MRDDIAELILGQGKKKKELCDAYSAYAKNFNRNMTDCHSDTPFLDFYSMWCKHKGFVNDMEDACNSPI